MSHWASILVQHFYANNEVNILAYISWIRVVKITFFCFDVAILRN